MKKIFTKKLICIYLCFTLVFIQITATQSYAATNNIDDRIIASIFSRMVYDRNIKNGMVLTTQNLQKLDLFKGDINNYIKVKVIRYSKNYNDFCTRNRLTEWKIKKVVRDSNTDFDGAIFQNIKTGRVIVAYQGSGSDYDRFQAAKAGFLMAYFNKQNKYASNLLREASKYNKGEILITGHSLGGMLAQMATFDMSPELYKSKKRIKCITFNSPPIFAEFFSLEGYSLADAMRKNYAKYPAIKKEYDRISTNYIVNGDPIVTPFKGTYLGKSIKINAFTDKSYYRTFGKYYYHSIGQSYRYLGM